MEEKNLKEMTKIELIDYFKKIIQLHKNYEYKQQKIEEKEIIVKDLKRSNNITKNCPNIKVRDYVKRVDEEKLPWNLSCLISILLFIILIVLSIVAIIQGNFSITENVISGIIGVLVVFGITYLLVSIFKFLFLPIVKLVYYIIGLFKYLICHKKDEEIKSRESKNYTNSNDEKIKKLESEISDLRLECSDLKDKISDNTFSEIHEDYKNPVAYKNFVEYLEKGRCDTFKECINLYEQKLNQEKISNEIDNIKVDNKKFESKMNSKLEELDSQMYDVKVKTEAQEIRIKDNLATADHKYKDYVNSTYKRAKQKVEDDKAKENR